MKQGHRRMIKTEHPAIPAILLTALLATSCVYDHYDNVGSDNATVGVELSIMTRAITSNSYTYETGSTWENYIDIAGGDYKIYFFTNDKNDATDIEKNTLIAEFVPKDMTAVEGSTYTQYTLSGNVGDDIATYSDFKVVVLANWGNYPTVTAGETAIDALVENDDAIFSAATFLNGVDETHLIPFFGVREYSNIEWREGWRTTLEGEITMLRALAKVEVTLNLEDSDIEGFDDVSIVRYNESGYCAPAGVYLRSDYDHGYSWDNDFTDNVHLVGGRNSDNNGTAPLSRQSASGTDVWTIYLPEYDNMGEDYCYIEVVIDDNVYPIYFANYYEGTTTAYGEEEEDDMPDRYNVCRNYLYRFVTDLVADEWEFSMDVIQYTAPLGIEEVSFEFGDYSYQQDDDNMTIAFNVLDVTSTFVMIPTLLYNGVDITAEAEWTCVCTSADETSVTVTKNPTVSEGPVEIHVTSLTATPKYVHKLQLTAKWTGTDGKEREIIYEVNATVLEGWPTITGDVYIKPSTVEPNSVTQYSAIPAKSGDRPKTMLVRGGRTDSVQQ